MKLNFTKLLVNICLATAFIGATLLLLNKTYGMREVIMYLFIILGFVGIALNFYVSKVVEKDPEFNVLFWIGIFITYLAIVMKIVILPYYQIVLMIGAGITGISYFVNPFSKEDQEEKDKLLDQ